MYENPNTLVVVGAYTIGKERIFIGSADFVNLLKMSTAISNDLTFLALAEELNSQIFVTREKHKVLECQDNPALSKRLTLQSDGARVHVLPMGQLNHTVC